MTTHVRSYIFHPYRKAGSITVTGLKSGAATQSPSTLGCYVLLRNSTWVLNYPTRKSTLFHVCYQRLNQRWLIQRSLFCYIS